MCIRDRLCTPPWIVVTNSGPIARAGFSDAFVTGPTVMMIPTTTRPITSPAQPSGERVSTMPRIVNSRIAVPIASINIAEPQVVVEPLKCTTPNPYPRSTALVPKQPHIANAPATPPATCAAQYDGTSRHGNLFVTASANVTAGLM